MRKWDLVVQSAKALKNSLIYSATFSVVLPIILWVWQPDLEIPMWLCMLVLTFLFLVICLLATAISILIDLYSKERVKTLTFPKVVTCNNGVLILGKSSIFEFNILVTILLKDENESETFMGIGQVINIQNNGLIQIEVKKWDEKHTGILDQMRNNNKSILNKILVKPIISVQRLEEYEGGL